MLPVAPVMPVTLGKNPNDATSLAPDGTVGRSQLDAVLQSEVVPTQKALWAATPAGDRQVAASKAAPQRFMGAGRIYVADEHAFWGRKLKALKIDME